MWSCLEGNEPKRVLIVKNMPDNPLQSNAIVLASFDANSSFNNYHSDLRVSSSQMNVMYGISGHKLYAGKIKGIDEKDKSIYGRERDVSRYLYFFDFFSMLSFCLF